jgi:AcrR family transcriptional regulator
MQTTGTKDRILGAARELFEEEGLGGFSVRAVTARAGTNVAAVNYHFGSKAALLRAMVRGAFESVAAEQVRLLEELKTGDGDPTVGGIMEAYSAPIFALFDADHAGEWGLAWMEARAGDPSGRERPPMMFAETGITRRYHGSLQRALPHVRPDELWWRLERATGLLMANQGRRASQKRRTPDEPGPEEERRWLLTFLAGALAAPGSAPDL